MNNLLVRSISGSIFVLAVAGSIILGQWSFALIFIAITILGIFEFYKLLKANGNDPQVINGILLGTTLFIITFLSSAEIISPKWFYILLIIGVYIFVFELYRKKDKPFTNISFTFFAVLYIALPLSLLSKIAFPVDEVTLYKYNYLLAYFVLIWLYDSAAYVFGVSFGKHRLFERISPKKSWEGLIGGSFVTILAGWGSTLIFNDFNTIDWIIIPIIIIVSGTFGDLSESMFKRSINQKDSGNIIPGHGGILDRFDAVFLSSPIVLAYLQLI